MAKKKVVRTRRREKKHVIVGQAHIQSTFNNTVVSLTDAQGNVLNTLVNDTAAGNATLAQGATSHQQYQFRLPDGARGAGRRQGPM